VWTFLEDKEWWKGFGSGVSIGMFVGLIVGIFELY
jgi:hypothetical protein